VTDLAAASPTVPTHGAAWVCVACHARMPMAENTCTSCGRAFGDGLAIGDREQTRRSLGRWGWLLKEFLVLNVIFILWRIVGRVSLFHEAGAFGRGHWLWHAERVLRLPNEAVMQRQLLPHETLSRIANGYYAWAHAVVFAVALIWLMVRHRDTYPRWRNLAVGFTGVSLLIGFLPVAPPRLLPNLGMVDLASRYHQSVYSSLGHGITDQLSAMPSVHIGWAVLVAAAVITVSTTRWRWLALAHPIITAYVVVVTANHYWLDGVVALVVISAVYFPIRRWRPALVP
jgi:hypothetical protein